MSGGVNEVGFDFEGVGKPGGDLQGRKPGGGVPINREDLSEEFLDCWLGWERFLLPTPTDSKWEGESLKFWDLRLG